MQKHITIEQIRNKGGLIFGQNIESHYFNKNDDKNLLSNLNRYIESCNRRHGSIEVNRKTSFYGLPDWFRGIINCEIPTKFNIDETRRYNTKDISKIKHIRMNNL